MDQKTQILNTYFFFIQVSVFSSVIYAVMDMVVMLNIRDI